MEKRKRTRRQRVIHKAVIQRTGNTMANRYQRGNQKPYCNGQTIQWPKDTKGVVRSRRSKDR